MVNVVRYAGFIFLALVSIFFTYNIAIGLGVESIEKIAMVLGSIGLEFFKIYAIAVATSYAILDKKINKELPNTMDKKEKKKYRPNNKWIMYSVYIYIALYSFGASLGYAAVTVRKTEAASTVVSYAKEISFENEKIERKNNDIKTKEKVITGYEKGIDQQNKIIESIQSKSPELIDAVADKKALDASYKEIDRLSKEITKTRADIDKVSLDIEEANSKIKDLNSQETLANRTTSKTMYYVIADTISLMDNSGKPNAKFIAFLVLFVFSSGIELGLFFLAPHFKKIDNVEIDNFNIVDYLGKDAYKIFPELIKEQETKEQKPVEKKPRQPKKKIEVSKEVVAEEPKVEVVKAEDPVVILEPVKIDIKDLPTEPEEPIKPEDLKLQEILVVPNKKYALTDRAKRALEQL